VGNLGGNPLNKQNIEYFHLDIKTYGSRLARAAVLHGIPSLLGSVETDPVDLLRCNFVGSTGVLGLKRTGRLAPVVVVVRAIFERGRRGDSSFNHLY
jgi:hypothetical protein